ncbi:MAG: AEC family transporter [Lachnospiraceae bacterium]|nr:AEC family transporter [Lachnospiraceae bacterium]
MSISVLINQLIVLFLIICFGYILNKCKILDANFNRRGSKFIVSGTMPAMTISSVLSLQSPPDSDDVLTVFIVAVSMYTIVPVIGYFLTLLIKPSNGSVGVYHFMYIFSNVGFMGYPILNAVYGPTAVFYAGIINIIFNLSCYSYGIVIINRGSQASGSMDLKKLISPGIICSFAALIIYAFKIHFPAVVENTVSTIGGITPALSMIIIGSTLATINIKEVFNDAYVYIFAIIKQIILPLAFMPVCRLLIKDDLVYGVTMIMLLMPVANTSVLFTTDFEHDESIAAKTVFITTAMSLITIPLGMIIAP